MSALILQKKVSYFWKYPRSRNRTLESLIPQMLGTTDFDQVRPFNPFKLRLLTLTYGDILETQVEIFPMS